MDDYAFLLMLWGVVSMYWIVAPVMVGPRADKVVLRMFLLNLATWLLFVPIRAGELASGTRPCLTNFAVGTALGALSGVGLVLLDQYAPTIRYWVRRWRS